MPDFPKIEEQPELSAFTIEVPAPLVPHLIAALSQSYDQQQGRWPAQSESDKKREGFRASDNSYPVTRPQFARRIAWQLLLGQIQGHLHQTQAQQVNEFLNSAAPFVNVDA